MNEKIIQFTGKLGFKQYIRGMPCSWGIKVFNLCGKSDQSFNVVYIN